MWIDLKSFQLGDLEDGELLVIKCLYKIELFFVKKFLKRYFKNLKSN